MVDKYCKGCMHRSIASTLVSCVYILHTGTRRPCPSGKGCTEYKKAETTEINGGKWNKKLAERLFREGKSDAEIANACRVSERAIKKWRGKNKLYRFEPAKRILNEELAREMYKAGKTDAEIAEAIGVEKKDVRSWRRREGLIGKPKGQWNHVLARKLFFDGKTDKEMAEACHVTVRCIEQWRWKEKLYRSEGHKA